MTILKLFLAVFHATFLPKNYKTSTYITTFVFKELKTKQNLLI